MVVSAIYVLPCVGRIHGVGAHVHALFIVPGAFSTATFSCDRDGDAPAVEWLGGWLW